MDIEQIYILVVDDLVDAADTTVELLSIWGYEAIACYSGASALESALLRRPSVVILDLAMPRMDGFEFARFFQELPDCGSVPLIALSGYSSQVYRVRAHEVGIRHYLLKPAGPVCLKNLLAREIVLTATPSPPHRSIRRGLVVEFPRPVLEFSVD
jgi:CheY-like chemotaxis protein